MARQRYRTGGAPDLVQLLRTAALSIFCLPEADG
ncbi:hypothetical protein ABIA96_004921 [Bradyrhizobium sp. LB11.1]